MLARNLHNFWNKFQPREQKLFVVLIFISFLGIFSFIAFTNLAKVSMYQNILRSEKENFNYVYEKANNFYKFSELQNEISLSKNTNEYISNLSRRFEVNDMQFSQEGGKEIFFFSVNNVDNAIKLLNTASQHPKISIKIVEIIPEPNSYRFKVSH